MVDDIGDGGHTADGCLNVEVVDSVGRGGGFNLDVANGGDCPTTCAERCGGTWDDVGVCGCENVCCVKRGGKPCCIPGLLGGVGGVGGVGGGGVGGVGGGGDVGSVGGVGGGSNDGDTPGDVGASGEGEGGNGPNPIGEGKPPPVEVGVLTLVRVGAGDTTKSGLRPGSVTSAGLVVATSVLCLVESVHSSCGVPNAPVTTHPATRWSQIMRGTRVVGFGLWMNHRDRCCLSAT